MDPPPPTSCFAVLDREREAIDPTPPMSPLLHLSASDRSSAGSRSRASLCPTSRASKRRAKALGRSYCSAAARSTAAASGTGKQSTSRRIGVDAMPGTVTNLGQNAKFGTRRRRVNRDVEEGQPNHLAGRPVGAAEAAAAKERQRGRQAAPTCRCRRALRSSVMPFLSFSPRPRTAMPSGQTDARTGTPDTFPLFIEGETVCPGMSRRTVWLSGLCPACPVCLQHTVNIEVFFRPHPSFLSGSCPLQPVVCKNARTIP